MFLLVLCRTGRWMRDLSTHSHPPDATAVPMAPGGDLPFRSDNGGETTDAVFLEQLKASARGPVATADASTDEAVAAAATVFSKLDVSCAAFARLSLTPRNVAKVMRGRA